MLGPTGATLHGQSPARIAVLKQLMSALPTFEKLSPLPDPVPGVKSPALVREVYLVYFDQPVEATLDLPGEGAYQVTGIDTWQMTTTPLARTSAGTFHFTAPTRGYLLLLSAEGVAHSIPLVADH